jgi:GT2 family glycosyltransferase
MIIYSIVVTYNGSYWIRKCLNSLLSSTQRTAIVVVDNGSADDTLSILENEYPDIIVCKQAKNLGFGKANNVGIKIAVENKADYVFLLNQDAWVKEDCIASILNCTQKNNYGIIAPFQLNYDGNGIEKYFNNYILGNECGTYISDLYFNQVLEMYPLNFVHAAGWFINVSCINAVGYFDELFFHYGEDNDYIQRLHYKKLKVGICTNAIMYHFGSNDGLNKDNALRFSIISKMLMLKNPSANFTGAIIIFFKNTFDSITTSLLARNFSQIKMDWKVFVNILKKIKKIKKSRKEQVKINAYCNN